MSSYIEVNLKLISEPMYYHQLILNTWFLLYNAVSRNMNVLTKGASGSTIKFLTKGMIDSIELLIPSSQLLTTYNQNSEALQKSIEALHRKVALAVEARDRLLPKLMNSEMEELL